MKFKAFIIATSLLASTQGYAKVGNPQMGDNDTAEALAVDKIVEDFVNRFTPEVIKKIAYARVNVEKSSIQFGEATKISNVDAHVQFGLSGLINLPIIEDNQLPKFPTLKTYNSATIKDFVPTLKIGPANTIVNVRARSLAKNDGMFEVTIEFAQKDKTGLRVEVNGEKVRVQNFTLKQIKFTVVTGEKGKISLSNGSCAVLQDISELTFDQKGGIIEGPVKTKPALCDYSGYYNYSTKKYNFILNYATTATPLDSSIK